MALFCKQPQQAEAIYLQSNLIFRAIEVNINLYNWERCVVGGGGGGMYLCVCVCERERDKERSKKL